MPLPKNSLLFGFKSKLTDEQKIYVDSIFDNQMTIVNAQSGTGKTTLAVACAKIIGKPLV
jgi:phosphate starvation-inducible PhoH-like protein